MSNYVQAFILNMDIPRAFDDIRRYRLKDSIDDTIWDIEETHDYNPDDGSPIFGTGKIEGYSVPRNAVIGDICFFMCQRTSTQTLAHHMKTAYEMGTKNISCNCFIDLLVEAFTNEGCGQKTNTSIHYLSPHSGNFEHSDIFSQDVMIVRKKSGSTKLPKLYSRIPGEEDPYTRGVFEGIIHEYTDKGYYEFCKYIQSNENDFEWFRLSDDYAGNILNNLYALNITVDNYEGKIYAIGRVCEVPENYKEKFPQQYRSRIYTDFDNAIALETPIDLEEFKNCVHFSKRGTFTYVLGDDYKELIDIISRENKLVDYYTSAVAVPMPLANLTKDNWIEVTNIYRRRFCLEDQFRAYYVNHFISLLGDNKTFFSECHCYHRNRHYTRVDNVIKFFGKYLPVEVKLNIKIEKDIKEQCNSYCHVDQMRLNDNRYIDENMAWQFVVVIDREAVYVYNPNNNSISKYLELDRIQNESDIYSLRNSLIKVFNKIE